MASRMDYPEQAKAHTMLRYLYDIGGGGRLVFERYTKQTKKRQKV
jgi:hypothetical protein